MQSAVPEPWQGDVVGSWALGIDGTVLPLNPMPVLHDGKPWHGQAGSLESPSLQSRAEQSEAGCSICT